MYPSGSPGDLTVVSLNIGGLPWPRYAHFRAEQFCRLVVDTDATVLNLQEVHGYGLLGHLRARLRSFPFVAFQPGAMGPRGGLVTFSKLPVEKVGFHSMFAATRAVERSRQPEGAVPRSLRKGVLVTRLTGSGIVVMNVHLIANTDGDWSPGNRFQAVHEAQVGAVLRLVDEARFARVTLIVSGDFNLPSESDLYRTLMDRGGWTDPFEGNPAPTFNPEFLPPGSSGHRIDYLWLRDRLDVFEAHETSILFTDKVRLANNRDAFISDHFGLRCKFVVKTSVKR